MYELAKFIIYHSQADIPFNFPHVLYLKLIKSLSQIGKDAKFAPYSPLINNICLKENVYVKLYEKDKEDFDKVLCKGRCLIKKPIMSLSNFKLMKLDIP